MAFQTPAGEVWLLADEGWDKEYKHVKYFSSESDQQSYIMSTSNPDRVLGEHKEGLQIIKDPLHGTIRLDGYQRTYWRCSYIAIKNQKINPDTSAHEYPFIYAFVDDVRCVSNKTFEIDYTVDVFQTYFIGQGDCKVNKAFIERTHTQSDDVGEHIEPEPFQPKKYVLQDENHDKFWSGLTKDWTILWFSSRTLSSGDKAYMGKQCGIYQGLNVYVMNASKDHDLSNTLVTILNDLKKDNKDVDVMNDTICAVIVPGGFIEQETGNLRSGDDNKVIKTSDSITKHQSGELDGYTPKNNKLYTYPYNFLLVSDNGQQSNEYAYEFFNNDVLFELTLSVTPNPEIMIVPQGYKTTTQIPNYEEKLVYRDFPQLPTITDSYRQWVATDKTSKYVSLVTGLLSGIAGVGVSVATGGTAAPLVVGGLAAGGSIANFAGSMTSESANADLAPDTIHASAPGALFVRNRLTVSNYQKCLCSQELKRIDDFFSRYGYAINTIDDVHLFNKRFNQHYVKTSECIITGGAPMQAIETITNAFNSGVTFWKDTIGDYTLKQVKAGG